MTGSGNAAMNYTTVDVDKWDRRKLFRFFTGVQELIGALL